METKYNIFLLNGGSYNWSNIGSRGLTKLNVADFDTPEAAADYIRTNRIFNAIILEFYVVTDQ